MPGGGLDDRAAADVWILESKQTSGRRIGRDGHLISPAHTHIVLSACRYAFWKRKLGTDAQPVQVVCCLGHVLTVDDVRPVFWPRPRHEARVARAKRATTAARCTRARDRDDRSGAQPATTHA